MVPKMNCLQPLVIQYLVFEIIRNPALKPVFRKPERIQVYVKDI